MCFNYEVFEMLCLEVGKAPSAVAEEAGIARNQPGKWRKGIAEPSNTTVKKLAVYFGVPIEKFFFDAEFVEKIPMTEQEISLSKIELELLRVFRVLSIKNQTRLLSFAYELEELEA